MPRARAKERPRSHRMRSRSSARRVGHLPQPRFRLITHTLRSLPGNPMCTSGWSLRLRHRSPATTRRTSSARSRANSWEARVARATRGEPRSHGALSAGSARQLQLRGDINVLARGPVDGEVAVSQICREGRAGVSTGPGKDPRRRVSRLRREGCTRRVLSRGQLSQSVKPV